MADLYSKQYKDYDRVSRYQVFPFYYNNKDNKYVYGITSHLLTSDITFVAHKVKKNDTLDSLALHYYNNPTYYWIIADFNKIRDPFEDLKIGDTLRIPTFSNIAFDI
jgi:hypothetical protein